MADTQSNKKYQLLSAIQDTKFNASALAQYHLSLYVNGTYAKICCINPTTKQCLLLNEYQLAHASQRLQAIEQLCQDHPMLLARDWAAVTLCIGNQQYTLVPQQLLQEEKLADYLSFSCPVGSNAVTHYTHYSLGAAVVFAVDAQLLNWFKATYNHTPSHTIHQASSLIQGAWIYLDSKKRSASPRVLVFVAPHNLHITVIHQGMLVYYNRFAYTSADELLYYLLIAMRTLQLDTNSHEVILGGDVDKQSPVYKKARHYIRRLTFMGKLPYLRTGRILSKKMMATHLDILSTHLCHREL